MAFAPRNQPLRVLARSGAPLSLALIASNILTLFLAYGAARLFQPAFSLLEFQAADFLRQPWGLFTYPAVSEGNWLRTGFACLAMWWFGASLERAWGTKAFALFFFGVSAAFALSIWLGLLAIGILGAGGQLTGLMIPTFGVVVGWALVNRGATVNLYGVLPLPALAVAILDCFILWFIIGHPVLGLFAQGGNLAAWAFVAWRPWNQFVGYREPRSRRRPTTQARRDDENGPRWNPLSQWEERKRREKLEALFRNSGYDDREDPPSTLH